MQDPSAAVCRLRTRDQEGAACGRGPAGTTFPLRSMRTLIAIPCYNEEANILRVLADVRISQPDIDCLIVDDGSTDATARVVRSAGLPGVTLIRHPVNLGYGGAIQTAAKYSLRSGYEALVLFDGDGQHSGLDVSAALAAIADGRADVAVGSRFLGSCAYRVPFSRRAGMMLFRGLLRVLSGVRITDPTSGFQALDRRAMRICASESFATAFPDADMLLLYHRAGLTLAEFPATFNQRFSGRSMHSFVSAVHYVYKMSISMLVVALTPHKPDQGDH